MPHNKVSEYFFYLCSDKKYPHNYDSISISYNQHLCFRILLHKVEYRSWFWNGSVGRCLQKIISPTL